MCWHPILIPSPISAIASEIYGIEWTLGVITAGGLSPLTSIVMNKHVYIDGFVQDCNNSIANTLELL